MTLTGSADPAPGFRALDDGSFRWNWCERLWEIVTLRSYGHHHLYLFCFGGLVIFKKFLQALFVNVNLLICDCLSWQVTLRLTAHGFKFFYMFPGPYIRDVNDTNSYVFLLAASCCHDFATAPFGTLQLPRLGWGWNAWNLAVLEQW